MIVLGAETFPPDFYGASQVPLSVFNPKVVHFAVEFLFFFLFLAHIDQVRGSFLKVTAFTLEKHTVR